MALHPMFRTRLQNRFGRRRFVGMLLLFAAAMGAAICAMDPPNPGDRVAALVICTTLAALGALAYLRGRELPMTDVMRLAEFRGGLLTLSEIATTLDLDPETALKTLRKLQKLGVAMPRWAEVRRNLWEFPDYLPISPEPQTAERVEMSPPREVAQSALAPLGALGTSVAGAAPQETAASMLAAAH